MNMSGKIIKEEKIEVPIPGSENKIEVLVTTVEYPPYKTRKKVIFCLRDLEAIQLGNLITRYHVKSRKSELEPIKYAPLYYMVKLNDDADVSEVEEYYYGEIEVKGEYEFKDKDEAMDFIDGLRYKGSTQGVFVGTKAEFNRWKEVFRRVKEDGI